MRGPTSSSARNNLLIEVLLMHGGLPVSSLSVARGWQIRIHPG